MSNIYGLSGIGISLLNNLGGVSLNNVGTKFKEDLRVLLETKKGTLIGDPGFGSNLYNLLYEPANEGTAALIREEVAATIENYYTNISVSQIDVTFKKYSIQLSIYYRIFNTNIEDTVMLEFIKGES
jgi:phage baseplate assembly protein W